MDGRGDICDGDIDGDGIPNLSYNCLMVPNNLNQSDYDGDGIGDVCDNDVDGDGAPNVTDICAESPLGDLVNSENGCTIDQLCPCSGPRGTTSNWRNHGKYVSCMAHVTNDFASSGLIDDSEKDCIVSTAAQSSCGNKK